MAGHAGFDRLGLSRCRRHGLAEGQIRILARCGYYLRVASSEPTGNVVDGQAASLWSG